MLLPRLDPLCDGEIPESDLGNRISDDSGVRAFDAVKCYLVREREYVFAACMVLGDGCVDNAAAHLAEYCGPLDRVILAGIACAILTEAALSFLGLGVQPPTPSWGCLHVEARGRGDPEIDVLWSWVPA